MAGCWHWVAVSSWKVFTIFSDFEQSYKLMKYYVGILNSSIRFTPVLLNLKMNIYPCEAKWWGGVSDFFEGLEKHMLRVHKAETGLSDFIYWNPLKLFYISETWIDWGVREQSFVQGRFPPWNAPSEPNKLFQHLGKQQKLGNNVFIHGPSWKGKIMAKYPVLHEEF